MKFSINDFFSKQEQIRRFLRIWSHLLKKCLKENFIICTVFCKNVRGRNKNKYYEKNMALLNAVAKIYLIIFFMDVFLEVFLVSFQSNQNEEDL